jgi:hypothetical protein
MPLSAKRVLTTKPYAMYFDGIDDYVDCGNKSSLDMNYELTAMAWIKPINAPHKTLGYIFYNWQQSAIIDRGWGRPISLVIISSDGAIYAKFWTGGTSKTHTSSLKVTEEWQTVGYTLNLHTRKLVFFKNNEFDEQTTTRGDETPLDIGYTLRIGMYPDANFVYLGLVSQVCIYNRALSKKEISDIYTYGEVIRNGLVLWLVAHPDYIKDIDNDGVLEWIDISGYGNHGKIYGATLIKFVRDRVAVSPIKRIIRW